MIILLLQKHRQYQEQTIQPITEQILRLYEPFIDPANEFFNLLQWKTIIDHHGDMLTRMIKTFVQLNEELYDYIKESFHYQQEFFSCLFHYWYRIVKYCLENECTHTILDIYHRYFMRLSWSNYRLSPECLLIFDELITINNAHTTSSTSIYEFILSIFSNVNIEFWTIDNDERLLTSLIPIYFRLLINIFLSSQAKSTQVNHSKGVCLSCSTKYIHVYIYIYTSMFIYCFIRLE
jgi:hypothetical protein